MQEQLFSKRNCEISLEEIFRAYFDCRKNKRNKKDSIKFELNFESEVIRLWNEINSRSYEISPLDVFVIKRPVKREIFAAKFRDRIVHHFIINKINYLFEKEFIFDTYSCRKGKGTHFGIRRINKFIRQCSHNYKKECWVLKLDIKGFFMHINKGILLSKINQFIIEKYKEKDVDNILWLCQKTINNNPKNNCKFKSFKKEWVSLPKSKSLFFSPDNTGLPVGNYTNQIFANFYLNSLDHFIKSKIRFRYYGRYVDDLVLIDNDKEKLKESIVLIQDFLSKNLKLTINPRKIYFQQYFKGVEFLGCYILPYRIYISKRAKGSFFNSIQKHNNVLERNKKPKEEEIDLFRSSLNSYLGLMSHYNTKKLRNKMLSMVNKNMKLIALFPTLW